MGNLRDINESVLKQTSRSAAASAGIIIPTFAQQKDPTKMPEPIRRRLKSVGLWDVDPLNLFRITWKNEPVERGGGFNDGNWIEFPACADRRAGAHRRPRRQVLPDGAHKVGAAFGCLVPRLVTGQFDPTTQKAVWPSTGNYCRGGAFDCALLACTAVAILPEEMTRERFEWLKSIGAEVIATPGCESNVKEIYDKCWEIRRTRPECVIFNQFEEFGNAVWHYHVTGGIDRGDLPADRRAGRPAGGLRLGDRLRRHDRGGRLPPHAASRTCGWWRPRRCSARRCFSCGFGEHRIEGIGDKHVPWIHNVRNTDMVAAIDDEQCLALMRLFNEDAGQAFLAGAGRCREPSSASCRWLGISGICNLVAAIKTARYFDMGARDVMFTAADRFDGPVRIAAGRAATQARAPTPTTDAGVDLRGTWRASAPTTCAS